ncbi:MAG: response regulator [Phycisphaerales bacterium]|jgi:DNA-binding response OmpR family regulator|nr:response regulator [Phycisphaerales bacterium]
MSRRILVVDDESHILHVLSLKLRNSGFIVDTAVDGEDATHQVAAMQPDLIITDLQMPYVNGLELCKHLCSDATTADIPVIILTARGYSLGNETAGLANVRDVISKPFSPRTILERVHRVLGTSADLAERAA